jgi:hypothetical protein
VEQLYRANCCTGNLKDMSIVYEEEQEWYLFITLTPSSKVCNSMRLDLGICSKAVQCDTKQRTMKGSCLIFKISTIIPYNAVPFHDETTRNSAGLHAHRAARLNSHERRRRSRCS